MEILSVIAIGVIIVFVIAFNSRCEKCSSWWSLSEIDRRQIGSQNITIQETRRVQKYRNHQSVHGSYDEYVVDVPGERVFYEVMYLCKKCGAETIRQKYNDHKF